MRHLFDPQVPLFNQWSDHRFSHELREISSILDELPEILHWVQRDICGDQVNEFRGSVGLTIEQIFRAAILKQQNSWSYEMLSLQCVDSMMTKSFLRLPDGKLVSKSCWQANIPRITDGIWLKINDHIAQYAADKNILAVDRSLQVEFFDSIKAEFLALE